MATQRVERLVLFYSTFVALKGQDFNPSDGDEIHEDYYNVKDEYLYGGTTLYPTPQNTVLKHALRVYKDKLTLSIRIESRPLRGRNKNVPLWVAFVPHDVNVRRWVRRTGQRQVELRELEQHVFFPGYVAPLSRNGRFLIDFTENNDAEDFIKVMQDHLSD